MEWGNFSKLAAQPFSILAPIIKCSHKILTVDLGFSTNKLCINSQFLLTKPIWKQNENLVEAITHAKKTR